MANEEDKAGPTWSLSVLLVRQDLRNDQEIIEDLTPLTYVPIPLPDGRPDQLVNARLFFERRPLRPPKWVSFFGDLLVNVDKPIVSSAPAVLLVPIEGRTLALAFSHGSSLLATGSTDTTFGLRVALNSINPKKVRSYDKRSFDALFRQTREQAAKESRLEDFGIDAERDLVRTVTGKPTDNSLGSSMAGSASLRVSKKITPSKLVHYLRRLYHKSTEKSYETEYPWLGRIEEIRDPELKETLDSYLEDSLSGNIANMWLAVPEIVDWAEATGFRFVLPSRSKSVFPALGFHALRKAAGPDLELSVDFLRRQRVEQLDSDDKRLKQWTLYDCLNAEITIGSEAYVLSSGAWYLVDSDLVADVDRELGTIEEAALPLPPFELSDCSEGGYNRRVAESDPNRFCCLDGQNIMFGGGKSRFELCDILDSNGDLIHVKRYGGSSVLSHLFAQGLISAELLMRRPSFRENADALVAKKQFSIGSERSFSLKARRKVVYVVIGGPANRERHELPLFSRLNLRNAARGIRAFDWDVRLQYVPEEELLRQYSRRKKSPARR